jgi:hypothetical protein
MLLSGSLAAAEWRMPSLRELHLCHEDYCPAGPPPEDEFPSIADVSALASRCPRLRTVLLDGGP